MHISFISNNYPTPSRPSIGTFIQQFVWAMARQGHSCTVINPTSLTELRHGPLPEQYLIENAGNAKTVQVHHPRFLSLSSRSLGFIHTGRLSNSAFTRCVMRALQSVDKPDIVYGHFLYPAGYAALLGGLRYGAPGVIGVGESYETSSLRKQNTMQPPWSVSAVGVDKARRHYSSNAYFLANSTLNAEMLSTIMNIGSNRILVEPNGVDLMLMRRGDREACRKKYAIEAKDFIVISVGVNRLHKGHQQVIGAIEPLNGISCIFAGNGTQSFRSSCILKSGPVTHDQIPELLTCADIFVLPTSAEGSCNAVIEAMACGLPIVTSNGRHMDDIIDDNVAIRIDSNDVQAIRDAILKLKNDAELRMQMSEACLKKAKQLDINQRARRVTAWMETLIN